MDGTLFDLCRAVLTSDGETGSRHDTAPAGRPRGIEGWLAATCRSDPSQYISTGVAFLDSFETAAGVRCMPPMSVVLLAGGATTDPTFVAMVTVCRTLLTSLAAVDSATTAVHCGSAESTGNPHVPLGTGSRKLDSGTKLGKTLGIAQIETFVAGMRHHSSGGEERPHVMWIDCMAKIRISHIEAVLRAMLHTAAAALARQGSASHGDLPDLELSSSLPSWVQAALVSSADMSTHTIEECITDCLDRLLVASPTTSNDLCHELECARIQSNIPLLVIDEPGSFAFADRAWRYYHETGVSHGVQLLPALQKFIGRFNACVLLPQSRYFPSSTSSALPSTSVPVAEVLLAQLSVHADRWARRMEVVIESNARVEALSSSAKYVHPSATPSALLVWEFEALREPQFAGSMASTAGASTLFTGQGDTAAWYHSLLSHYLTFHATPARSWTPPGAMPVALGSHTHAHTQRPRATTSHSATDTRTAGGNIDAAQGITPVVLGAACGLTSTSMLVYGGVTRASDTGTTIPIAGYVHVLQSQLN